MKWVLAALAAVAIVWFLPGINESQSQPCGALAVRLLQYSAQHDPELNDKIVFGMARLLGDVALAIKVKSAYPQYPPEVSCVGLYWKTLLDPTSMAELAPRGGPVIPR